ESNSQVRLHGTRRSHSIPESRLRGFSSLCSSTVHRPESGLTFNRSEVVMYPEMPEPAEYPELTDQDIASLAEDRISALPDAMLTALLDDLHERTAGMTRQDAAMLEPVIAALELEAIRRGITR